MGIYMASATTRTVGTSGLSQSRYVTLPRGWCNGSGVDRGTRVKVLTNRVLVVLPPGADRELATVLRLMKRGSL
jgi:hypothetical protein